MVNGLNNTVEALNDYLVELLQERDVLLGQQVDMGRISKIIHLIDSISCCRTNLPVQLNYIQTIV